MVFMAWVVLPLSPDFTCNTCVIPLDLKPLPNSPKYAFLGLDESSPMVIAFDLDQNQEQKLLD